MDTSVAAAEPPLFKRWRRRVPRDVGGGALRDRTRRRVLRTLLLALVALSLSALAAGGGTASADNGNGNGSAFSSSPADKTHPTHPASAEDKLHGKKGRLGAQGFVRDGGSTGSEPSIAINPANVNNIVIAAGFGGWNGNAPLLTSTDGGDTFTSNGAVTAPPGAAGSNGCPCDQAIDFGRGGVLYGTFLSFTPTDVYSGSTTNSTSSASWSWFTTGAPPVAQLTNAAAGATNSDQPWLLVGPNPGNLAQDNVYVAYDNFTTSPVSMRVASSSNATPPNFGTNVQTGVSGGGINPGHRLAVDSVTGWVYDLWQQSPGGGSGGSQNINYRLNRSVDGGATWTLNGSATGIVVANADSTQPNKFGTTNALLGGVDHAAVDPRTGWVYYVFGNRDSGTGSNRLSISRLQGDAAMNLNVAQTSFVTGQVQAALPSVAVASNGTVGVLYDTFDGFSANGFPIFTAHFATSTDHAVTFTDNTLMTFLGPNKDNGNARQRDLGDYQQVKAVGDTFYGVFSGNPAALGGGTSTIDPIFFKVVAPGGPKIAVSGSLDFGSVPVGSAATRTVTIQNGGDAVLLVNDVRLVTGSDASFSVLPNPTQPQTVQPGGSVDFTVRFAPTSGGTKNGTVRIQNDDPNRPQVDLSATGVAATGKIAVSGSLDFGTVARGSSATRAITVQNQGGGT